MILPHSPAPGLEDLPIVPPVFGEYDRGMKAFPAAKLGGRRFLVRKVEARMCTFYDPNGLSILREKFFKMYNNEYYKDCEKKEIKGLHRVKREDEEKIDSILARKEGRGLTNQDVGDILSWKIPGTYESASNLVIPKQYKNKTINVENVLNFIPNGGASPIDKKGAKNLVKNLITIPYIGFVYAVTILYFASQGEYPIYDRFAHIALLVIDRIDKPKKCIAAKDLNRFYHSNSCQFDVLWRDYEGYMDLLNKHFQSDLTDPSSRKVDRALWAYGHLFNDNKTNQRRLQNW